MQACRWLVGNIYHEYVEAKEFLVAAMVFTSFNGGAMQADDTSVRGPADEPAIATFAAGCFWCTEAVFQETAGVTAAISGYAGGEHPSPTYREVVSQLTDHIYPAHGESALGNLLSAVNVCYISAIAKAIR